MKFQTPIAVLVSFALIPLPLTTYAQQAPQMISTQQVIAQLSHAELQTNIAKFLERADVQAQMQKSGVSSEEAALRLASLSSQELQQISNQIEAGRSGGLLELILVIILILILVGRI